MARSAIIYDRIRRYEEDCIETAEKLKLSIYLDDADLLQNVIMPDRVHIFRKPKKGESKDIPVISDEGWVEAEDLAVLALMKVDESIDARQDNSPEDLVVSSGLLLEAFRSLLLAERVGGRKIWTADEFKQFERNYVDFRRQKQSKENSEAVNSRSTEKLRLYILKLFHQMRLDWPDKNAKTICREIIAKYEIRADHFGAINCDLSPTRSSRTIREWIKKEISQNNPTPQNKTASLSPTETNQ